MVKFTITLSTNGHICEPSLWILVYHTNEYVRKIIGFESDVLLLFASGVWDLQPWTTAPRPSVPINQQCTESLHIDTIAPSPELSLSIVCSILVRFSQNPLPYVCKSIALTEDKERPFLLQVTFPAPWVFLLKPSNRLVHPGSGPSMKFLDCLRQTP